MKGLNLKELHSLAEGIRLVRKGNYSEVILQGEREGLIVLAYSYENLIGLLAPNSEYWIYPGYISKTTNMHKEMFTSAWGIK